MKRIVLLFIVFATVTFSCKEKETERVSKDPEYAGEFIYTADAAVLKGSNFIYGVALDEMAEELAKRVKPVKRDEFDMVPVVVKGTLKNKEEGEEGWNEILTITEIVSVSDTPSEADVKIEEKKS
tara:strand:- start:58415 stop:58789 length:375 start_codon:yes stop_codon:yes gene_type:complete